MIENIKQMLSNINVSALENVSLKERLVLAYTEKTKAELIALLETPDDAVITAYLADNWALVKGTYLCYTSIPYAPITKVLCQLAQVINVEKPLAILMPGINLDSERPEYPHLDDPSIQPEYILKNHILSAEKNALIPIAVLLKENSLRPYRDQTMDEQEQRRYMLVEQQRKLQQPQDLEQNQAAISEIDARLKSWLHEELNRLVNHSPETQALYAAQQRLIMLKSDKSNLLGQLTELCRLLRFNDAHEGIGRQENAGDGAFEAIRIFVDYYQSLGYQLAPLSAEVNDRFIHIKVVLEQQRLEYQVKMPDGAIVSDTIHFDELPEFLAILKKIEARNATLREQGKPEIILDESVLYGELTTISDKIFTITHQRKHTDPALDVRNRIPEALHKSIDLLIDLSRNPESNVNATENMLTCVGTRREEIEAAMKRQSVLLATIGHTENTRAAQIDKAQQELECLETNFKASLTAGSYSRSDKLFAVNRLFNTFSAVLQYRSLDDLRFLMSLDPEELKELLIVPDGNSDLALLFKSYDALADFITDFSSEKIRIVLEATAPHLIQQLKLKHEHLEMLLFGQSDEKFKTIARFLIEHQHVKMSIVAAHQIDKENIIRELLEDKAMAIAAVWKEGDAMKYIPDALKNDLGFLLEVMKKNRRILPLVSSQIAQAPELKRIASIESEEIRIAAIDIYGSLDTNFIRQRLEQTPRLICYLPEHIKEDKIFDEYRNNSIFIVKALMMEQKALSFASDALQQSLELQSLANCYLNSLRKLSCQVYLNRDNKEFVQKITESENIPCLFQHASMTLKNDVELVTNLIRKNQSVLYYASTNLQANKVLQRIASIDSEPHRNHACDLYLSLFLSQVDKQCALEEIRQYPGSLLYLPEDISYAEEFTALREDPQYIVTLMITNKEALSYASTLLQQDPALISISKIHSRASRAIACNFYLNRKDEELARQKINNNPSLFKYATDSLKDDINFVVTLLLSSTDIFEYASNRIQQNRCLEKMDKIKSLNRRKTAFEIYLRQNDLAFIVQELQKEPMLIFYMPENILEATEIMVLCNDPIFIIKAMQWNVEALKCASTSLQEDPLLKSIASLSRMFISNACQIYLNNNNTMERQSALSTYYCNLLRPISNSFNLLRNNLFDTTDLFHAHCELDRALNEQANLSEVAKMRLQADPYINSTVNALAQLQGFPDSEALFTQLMQTQRLKIHYQHEQ